MEDITLMESIERYLRGEMNQEEKTWFETFRTQNSAVDHKVVEQALILKKLDQLSERKSFLVALDNTYATLNQEEAIIPLQPKKEAKIISIWHKNWKPATVAACIAGFTTLLTWSLSTKLNKNELEPKFAQLSTELKHIKDKQESTEILISNSAAAPSNIAKSPYGGTGFLINSKGLLVTSYHIIEGKKLTGVIDHNGKEYEATVVSINEISDLAILKINDTAFKTSNLPYNLGIKKTKISEDVFTLGFPFGSLGYSKGYLSSKYGLNNDSNFVQVSIPANHGQSGSPVFDNNGNVLGIISKKIDGGESIVYATQIKNLLSMVRKYNNDKKVKPLTLGTGSTFSNSNRVSVLENIEPFIFQVKSK